MNKYLVFLFLIIAFSSKGQVAVTLDSAIANALRTHPQIQFSQQGVEQQKALKRGSFNLENPSVGTEAPYGKKFELALQQNFQNPVIYIQQSKLGKQNILLSEQNQQVTKWQLIRDVRTVYLSLQYAEIRVKQLSYQDSIFHNLFVAAERRYNAGDAGLLEKVSAETKSKEIENFLNQAKADLQNAHKTELSNDLGAIAGLLFEIGMQKLVIGGDEYLSEAERNKLEKLMEKRHKDIKTEKEDEHLHSEMQYHLLKIGSALGYDVICASNDKSRSFNGNNFSFLCLARFPDILTDVDTASTIKLIDVLWFQKGTNNVIAAFEVEKSTSIYSGILRLTDLSYTIANGDEVLYLIAPNSREKDVQLQLSRPAIRNNKIKIKYILFSDLRQHCDALCKLGDNHLIMEKIAKEAVLN